MSSFGDVSYAVGYLQSWDEFLYMVTPFTASSVSCGGVGTHLWWRSSWSMAATHTASYLRARAAL